MLLKLYQFADLLRLHGRKRHMTEDHALGRRGEEVATAITAWRPAEVRWI
jgi:hypothetical protein